MNVINTKDVNSG